MPQLSMLPGDRPDVGLRITIIDHTTELEDGLTISIEVRQLDGDWTSFGGVPLAGRGRDFLSSAVEDLVSAWHYEDRPAILREAQRNTRQARIHNRKYMRSGA